MKSRTACAVLVSLATAAISPAYDATADTSGEPSLGPLLSLSPADFLKLPDGVQAIYVAGVLDGVSYTSYGYSLPDHDRYVRCASTLRLGALAERTVAWLRANPKFAEGTATAVAKALGAYCKDEGAAVVL